MTNLTARLERALQAGFAVFVALQLSTGLFAAPFVAESNLAHTHPEATPVHAHPLSGLLASFVDPGLAVPSFALGLAFLPALASHEPRGGRRHPGTNFSRAPPSI